MSRCLPGSSRSKGAVRLLTFASWRWRSSPAPRARGCPRRYLPHLRFIDLLTYDRAGADEVTVELSWSPPPLDGPGAAFLAECRGRFRWDTASSATTSSVRSSRPRHRAGANAANATCEGPRRYPACAHHAACLHRVNLGLPPNREGRLGLRRLAAQREGYLSALGYSVFAFVDGFEPRPARLRVAGPEAWPVFSTLAPRWPGNRRGSGRSHRRRFLRAGGQSDCHGPARRGPSASGRAGAALSRFVCRRARRPRLPLTPRLDGFRARGS